MRPGFLESVEETLKRFPNGVTLKKLIDEAKHDEHTVLQALVKLQHAGKALQLTRVRWQPCTPTEAAVAAQRDVNPLPRCKHKNALRDHAGTILEPSCGCRLGHVAEPGLPPSRAPLSVTESVTEEDFDRQGCTGEGPAQPAVLDGSVVGGTVILVLVCVVYGLTTLAAYLLGAMSKIDPLLEAQREVIDAQHEHIRALEELVEVYGGEPPDDNEPDDADPGLLHESVDGRGKVIPLVKKVG